MQTFNHADYFTRSRKPSSLRLGEYQLAVNDYIVSANPPWHKLRLDIKGMDRHSVTEKADQLLNQTGMLANRRRKIEEMSNGMAQISQFIVTIVHDPEMVVLDEPFSGLDTVNTELVKGKFCSSRE